MFCFYMHMELLTYKNVSKTRSYEELYNPAIFREQDKRRISSIIKEIEKHEPLYNCFIHKHTEIAMDSLKWKHYH